MERTTDGDFEVLVSGPVGFGNNIYVIMDHATGEAAFVDAPGEPEHSIAAAEALGVRPSTILLTHSHGDHTACLDALKQTYGCRVYGDAREPWLKDGQLDALVSHGQEVKVGNLAFRTISVPGHTPGSTTYAWGKHAFVGDTLFPGGPGRSGSNALLQEEIQSITTQLYALGDDTVIYPGHGDRTTIGASKAEYAVFAGKSHDPNLHGDVDWFKS